MKMKHHVPDSPKRDRAWGCHYARRGIAAVTNGYFTPLSNASRIALYQMRRAVVADASRYAGGAR